MSTFAEMIADIGKSPKIRVFGLLSDYQPDTTHKDVMYWATDKSKLLLNGKALSITEEEIAEINAAIERVDSLVDSVTDELSNVLGEEVLDDQTFEEFGVVTREDLNKDLFIKLWEKASIPTYAYSGISSRYRGKYNKETGYFELNGLTDITFDEALDIYNAGVIRGRNNSYMTGFYSYNQKIRTNLLPSNLISNISSQYVFNGCSKLEVAITPKIAPGIAFYEGCRELREILVYCPVFWGGDSTAAYKDCVKLENIYFETMSSTYVRNIDLHWSPLITLDTFTRMVKDWTNSSATLTINVHPDVYAKLTTEPEWIQLNQDALAKNIIFATA